MKIFDSDYIAEIDSTVYLDIKTIKMRLIGLQVSRESAVVLILDSRKFAIRYLLFTIFPQT